MADLQHAKSFFKMDVVKTAAVAGGAGGAYVFISDFFLDRYFKDDSGEDQENAELMRAGVQAVGGLALAGIVSKWSKAAAVGIAVGAVLGAVRHLFTYWDFSSTLDEWFPEEDSTTGTGNTNASGLSTLGRSRETGWNPVQKAA